MDHTPNAERSPDLPSPSEADKNAFPQCFGSEPLLADKYLAPQVYNANRWGADIAVLPRINGANKRRNIFTTFAAAHPDQQRAG